MFLLAQDDKPRDFSRLRVWYWNFQLFMQKNALHPQRGGGNLLIVPFIVYTDPKWLRRRNFRVIPRLQCIKRLDKKLILESSQGLFILTLPNQRLEIRRENYGFSNFKINQISILSNFYLFNISISIPMPLEESSDLSLNTAVNSFHHNSVEEGRQRFFLC